MKKKYLTLFMSIVLMAANIEGTEVAVYGADFTSEESVEADDISLQEECEEEENSEEFEQGKFSDNNVIKEDKTELFDGTVEAAGADMLTEGESQIAEETKKSKNSIVGITLAKKDGYSVLSFYDTFDMKIAYEDGTTEVNGLNSDTTYEDKYGNSYYYSIEQKRVAGAKERTCIFHYYVTNADGSKKTFTDSMQVKEIIGMSHAEVNTKYEIKGHEDYIFIPPRTAEYTITYTGDSNMWFWEVNKWEDGKYSIGFVDREKTDYGSYKVVKSKLEKDKEYLITTVDDNSFYVSNLETEHSWDKGKITKAATCTEDGIKTYTCVTCKKNRTESIPKAGHKKVTKSVKKATCKEKGYTGDIYCKNCGKLFEKGKAIEKLSHKWSEWKKISSATALKRAKQQRSCVICKSVQTQEYGNKLKSVMKVNYNTITLKIKQFTNKLKVSGMAKGDYVSKVQSGNTGIIKVVKFTKDGKIQLAAQGKTGNTKLTIRLAGGAVKNITVKVQKVKTTALKVSFKKITMKSGAKKIIKTTVVPSNSQEKVTYKSSSVKTATVSSKGVITAKKCGQAKITVKSGTKTQIITVIVK